MENEFDFCGWATKNNVKCSDGRTILKDAFKHNDHKKVPLVWSHVHNNPLNVLGHALLENREEGIYAYCKFNDSEYGQAVKKQVMHGDITQLSIYANQLKERAGQVMHGNIREVSLVIAGANPEAYIDMVMAHGEDADSEGVIYTGEDFMLGNDDIYHSIKEDDKKPEDNKDAADENKKEKTVKDVLDTFNEKQLTALYALIGSAIEQNSGEAAHSDLMHSDSEEDDEGETVKDIIDTLNEDQLTVLYMLVGLAVEESENNNDEEDEDDEESKGGNEMKHSVFETAGQQNDSVLCHADQEEIIKLAKSSSVGSLKAALGIYAADSLSHAFSDEDIESMFPDFKDVKPGAPELLTRDMGWVDVVLSKTHKSPISRIRTRQMDARSLEQLRANGYEKGKKKKLLGNAKLLKRTTDPQTVYVKDKLERDDIVDITDFDVVEYQYGIMKMTLNEEVARAVMIGDGREDGEENKIYPEHIRPIWTDDDLYCIHAEVDVAAAKKEIQGSNTNAYFGDNYVYAEAIITAATYARENFKGSGTPDFFCTPHLLNVMLLARDRNGRRIYNSKAELATTLNVNNIYTVEQFAGQTRTAADGKEKKLLGIFVNLADYHIGSTKGGEITRFNQFDIDFNQEKYLIETRLSGALAKVYSAIVLEEPVVAESTTPSTPNEENEGNEESEG